MVLTGGLHPSGREQVVPSWLALFSRLARRHAVHAFVLRHLGRACAYELRGFTVHDLGRPWAPAGLGVHAQGRALWRALLAHGPFDLIHGFWADPAGLLAARAARRLGIPSVVTCDSGEFVSLPDIDYGSQRTWRGRARVRAACRLATRVHVCSDYMAQLASTQGVRATVIPLGIDAGAEVSSGEDRAEASGRWRLIQAASLSRVKNQRLLIEAVARLSPREDVHLDLVGEDTLGGELQGLARALGVSDRVIFHGFVPNDGLAPLYRRARLYVQASRHEAAAVAVLEAAACGVPAVGTRVGYVADLAPDGAVAVDDVTADGFAHAIDRTLRHADLRARLAKAARAFATAHDADWTATAMERLYEALAARRQPRQAAVSTHTADTPGRSPDRVASGMPRRQAR
jgi:glycosyltransferase involved in cell wall biosynthesis